MKKRVISLLLAVTLLLSLGVSAFAAEPAGDTPEPDASAAPAETGGTAQKTDKEKKEEPDAPDEERDGDAALATASLEPDIMLLAEDPGTLEIDPGETHDVTCTQHPAEEDEQNWIVDVPAGYELQKFEDGSKENITTEGTYTFNHVDGTSTRQFKVKKEITKVKIVEDESETGAPKAITVTYEDEKGYIQSKEDYKFTYKDDKDFLVAVKGEGVELSVKTTESHEVTAQKEAGKSDPRYVGMDLYSVKITDSDVTKVTITAKHDGKVALFVTSGPSAEDMSGKVEINGFSKNGQRVDPNQITEIKLKEDGYMLFPCGGVKATAYEPGERKYTVTLDGTEDRVDIYIYAAAKLDITEDLDGLEKENIKITYTTDDPTPHSTTLDNMVPVDGVVLVSIPSKFEEREIPEVQDGQLKKETVVTRYALSELTGWEVDGERYENANEKDKEAHSYQLRVTAGQQTVKAKVVESPVCFTDVRENQWYYEYVSKAVVSGFINGFEDGTFKPESSASRAQAVMMIYNMAGDGTKSTNTGTFTDLKESWYLDPVYWATSESIIEGVSAHQFGPNYVISRAQIMTMLYRLADSPAVSGELSTKEFADAGKIPVWAKKAMKWAYDNHIIDGIPIKDSAGRATGKNNIAPNNGAKRDEICTILVRYQENIKP